jgi:hypothetical protein
MGLDFFFKLRIKEPPVLVFENRKNGAASGYFQEHQKKKKPAGFRKEPARNRR